MSPQTEFRSAGSNLGATIRQSLRMMAGQDVSNYTLVFLDSSKQYNRGESKNIVVPYIVLGRASSCNVQYGDEYGTVSRQHCSIQADQEGYILIHNPQATNPTLVDGKPVNGYYRLKTGDEIQLSYEGPKIRFLMDKPAKTSTMGFTRRMSMALGQSLRPYRRALAIVSVLLVAAIGYSVWSNIQIHRLEKQHASLNSEMKASDERIQAQEAELQSMQSDGNANAQRISSALNTLNAERQKRAQLEAQMANVEDRMNSSARSVEPTQKNTDSKHSNETVSKGEIPANSGHGGSLDNSTYEAIGTEASIELEKLESSIYYIQVEDIKIIDRDLKEAVYPLSRTWSGTGFVTSDGKFITARHVIEPWRFLSNECDPLVILNDVINDGGEVDIKFKAYSSNGKESFSFTNTTKREFDDSQDVAEVYFCSSRKKFKNRITAKSCKSYSADWVYFSMQNRPSLLTFDRNLSKNLNRGETVHFLGYDLGLHLQEGYTPATLQPIYSEGKISQKGIVNGLIAISNQSFSRGSSGGPVFVRRGNDYIVIGLISAKAEGQGIIVLTDNIR